MFRHEFYHMIALRMESFSLFDGYASIDDVVEEGLINDLSTKFIKTPKVLEKAREHFGCNEMQGL